MRQAKPLPGRSAVPAFVTSAAPFLRAGCVGHALLLLALLAALLFALTPTAELSANYPVAWQHGAQRALPERWDVRYQQPLNFELSLMKGPKYQVTPLSGDMP